MSECAVVCGLVWIVLGGWHCVVYWRLELVEERGFFAKHGLAVLLEPGFFIAAAGRVDGCAAESTPLPLLGWLVAGRLKDAFFGLGLGL